MSDPKDKTIRALKRRIRELETALNPFAAVARINFPISEHWTDDKPNEYFIPRAWPRWGDFRYAREVLLPVKKPIKKQ